MPHIARFTYAVDLPSAISVGEEQKHPLPAEGYREHLRRQFMEAQGSGIIVPKVIGVYQTSFLKGDKEKINSLLREDLGREDPLDPELIHVIYNPGAMERSLAVASIDDPCRRVAISSLDEFPDFYLKPSEKDYIRQIYRPKRKGESRMGFIKRMRNTIRRRPSPPELTEFRKRAAQMRAELRKYGLTLFEYAELGGPVATTT